MEFLVRINDKSPAMDASKAGDVIVFKPDGWAWSQAELSNPDWVIIRCQLTQIEAEALVAAPPIDVLNAVPKARRARRLNRARFNVTGGTGNIINISAAIVRSRILEMIV